MVLFPSQEPGSGKYTVRKQKADETYVITLKIDKAELSDEGEYECFVTNEAGSASEKVQLTTQRKKITLYIGIPNLKSGNSSTISHLHDLIMKGFRHQ